MFNVPCSMHSRVVIFVAHQKNTAHRASLSPVCIPFSFTWGPNPVFSRETSMGPREFVSSVHQRRVGRSTRLPRSWHFSPTCRGLSESARANWPCEPCPTTEGVLFFFFGSQTTQVKPLALTKQNHYGQMDDPNMFGSFANGNDPTSQ